MGAEAKVKTWGPTAISNLTMSTSFPGWAVVLGVSRKEMMVNDRPGAVSLWREAPVEI